MPLNNQLRARHPAIKAYCRPGQFSSFPMLRCNSSWEPPSWVSAVWETENISNFRKIGKCHRSGRDCVIDGVTGVAGYGGDRAVDVVAHLWRGRIRISMRDVVCLENISVSPLSLPGSECIYISVCTYLCLRAHMSVCLHLSLCVCMCVAWLPVGRPAGRSVG